VPLLMQYPNIIESNQIITHPVHHVDIFTTVLSIIQPSIVISSEIDGVNILNTSISTRTFFWKSGHYLCIRNGDWKLSYSERPLKYWLFNLHDDPREENNLFNQSILSKNVELLLIKQLKELNYTAKTPLWNTSIEIPVPIHNNVITSLEDEHVYWAN